MVTGRKPLLRFVATADTGLGHATRSLALSQHLPGSSLVVDPETAATLEHLWPALPPIIPLSSTAAPGAWLDQVDGPAHVILDTQFTGNAGATAKEVAALKQRGCLVTVIDSMPPDHFETVGGYAPDILVTPYLGAGDMRPTPDADQWLRGARFAILSPTLVTARTKSQFPDTPSILVTCGGSDPGGLSALIVERLRNANAAIHVVVGPLFSDALRRSLKALAHANDTVVLHEGGSSLVGLYQRASLVVGRAGLTRYEAACLGRNGIYLAEGSDYAEYFDGFTRSGIAEIFIAGRDSGMEAFLQRLDSLNDPAVLASVARPNMKAFDTVDGRGVDRVAEAILHCNAERSA